MGRVSIADDEPDTRSFLAEALEPDDHEVVTARDGDEAADLLGRYLFDVVITDLRMPGCDGLSLLARLRVSPLQRYKSSC
jgi:CheY-like chemotaxis protein